MMKTLKTLKKLKYTSIVNFYRLQRTFLKPSLFMLVLGTDGSSWDEMGM